ASVARVGPRARGSTQRRRSREQTHAHWPGSRRNQAPRERGPACQRRTAGERSAEWREAGESRQRQRTSPVAARARKKEGPSRERRSLFRYYDRRSPSPNSSGRYGFIVSPVFTPSLPP